MACSGKEVGQPGEGGQEETQRVICEGRLEREVWGARGIHSFTSVLTAKWAAFSRLVLDYVMQTSGLVYIEDVLINKSIDILCLCVFFFFFFHALKKRLNVLKVK